MRVTRLEIFGFKSFVERFSLNFDENIIGVVGPNGCGKSNIVDALRWVLGETQARQLRGSTLEDLIFNGSESRRPLGMAEVSITIRPDDGWARHAAVAARGNGFTPPAPAAGESPAAAAAPQPEDYEAGQAHTTDVELTAADGENLPEEAASDAAIDPAIEAMPYQSLLDIPGIFEMAEIQLTRRLYRSGESEYFINRIPCRLRDMIDLYRLIGLGSRGLSIVQQGQIGELISRKPIERRELLEEAAGIAGFRARIEAAQRKLERTAENMSRLNDIILEVEKQVRVLKRQASRAKARQELRAELEAAELELFSLKAGRLVCRRQDLQDRMAQLGEQMQGCESSLSHADARQEEQKGKILELDTEMVSLRRRRDELYQAMVAEREKVRQLQLELGLLDGREKSLVDGIGADDARREGLLRERTERSAAIAPLEAALEEIASERQRVEAELLAVQERVTQELNAASAMRSATEGAVASVDTARLERIAELTVEVERLAGVADEQGRTERDLRDIRGKLRGAREALSRQQVAKASIDAEIRSLERQLRAFGEQTALRTGQSPAAGLAGDAGEEVETLAAKLHVPHDLQKAVSAVLGEREQFLLSNAPLELARSYARAQSENPRAEGGASRAGPRVGVVDREPAEGENGAAVLSPEERALAPSAVMLDELLKLDGSVRRIFCAVTGAAVFVETLDEGAALNAGNRAGGRPTRTIVTRAGEVITPWGWYTTQGEGLGLGIARRIEELKAAAVEATAEESRLREAAAEIEENERQRSEQAAALAAERDRLVAQQRELSKLLQAEQEHERRLREEEKRRERQLRDAALAEERQAQARVRQVDAQAAQKRSELEFERRRIATLEQDIERLQQAEQSKKEALEKLQEERSRLEATFAGATTGPAVAQAEQLQGEFDALEGKLAEIENARAEINLELAEAAEQFAQHRRELDGFTREHNSLELALEKLQLELASIHEECRRHYEDVARIPDLDAARELVGESEEAAQQIAQRIQLLTVESERLRRRLEREGEVDPQSIEQYEAESARLEEMKLQYADLDAARKTLERTIRQLKDISRARFLETFKDVSTRFDELVPRLFGGGAGHLTLIDPEDPLTSGVEISVRPPGKRITSMELLSGGEKALVATAVLISMFLHRPSPICVLDEVDAPLDEANLDRFISIIREIAHTTQFLIITHNKATMSAVDRLLGITMKESGVSTALSVTFAEAEAELERWAVNA